MQHTRLAPVHACAPLGGELTVPFCAAQSVDGMHTPSTPKSPPAQLDSGCAATIAGRLHGTVCRGRSIIGMSLAVPAGTGRLTGAVEVGTTVCNMLDAVEVNFHG